MKNTMRLERFLADCGVATRSDLKTLIRKGRVSVDGIPVRDPKLHVRQDESVIALDGKTLHWQKRVVFLLCKPAGVITATEDPKLPTVLDLLPDGVRRMGLFPVGRLDRDTEGLLLLTNDGQLAHALLAPKKHVDKLYEAVLDVEPEEGAEARFLTGIALQDGTVCRPAILERIPVEAGNPPVSRITIVEGKFHQVKRMFAAAGSHVMNLKRLRMGPITLDPDMKPGAFRPLTPDELEALERQAGLESSKETLERQAGHESSKETGRNHGQADNGQAGPSA